MTEPDPSILAPPAAVAPAGVVAADPAGGGAGSIAAAAEADAGLLEELDPVPVFAGPGAPLAVPPPSTATSSWKERAVYDAMGNSLRRRMFYLLARTGGRALSIEQIASRVQRKRSITGKHLAILRTARLISEVTSGREALQQIHPDLLAQPGAPAVFDTGWMVIRVPGLRRVKNRLE